MRAIETIAEGQAGQPGAEPGRLAAGASLRLYYGYYGYGRDQGKCRRVVRAGRRRHSESAGSNPAARRGLTKHVRTSRDSTSTRRRRRPTATMLQRMVSAIRHRGPDGSGFHVEPGVGLGHARLSIIDLAGGAQPVHNEDQTVWISYNGEVFNYVELRRMLEQRGHRFYTNTDTEVIVHLYEELGDDFVQELNGQFAFALWDRPRRRLLLVRDRTGILPLYYTRTRQGVLFASEVKALLASGELQRGARSERPRRDLHVLGAARAAHDVQGRRPGVPGRDGRAAGRAARAAHLLALGIPGGGRAPHGTRSAARSASCASSSTDATAHPPAGRRARGRVPLGRPRLVVAGRAAQSHRARHAADVLDRLRRRRPRRDRASAADGRRTCAPSTRASSARWPTSRPAFPTPSGTPKARCCARHPRRCACSPGWCAARASRWC